MSVVAGEQTFSTTILLYSNVEEKVNVKTWSQNRCPQHVSKESLTNSFHIHHTTGTWWYFWSQGTWDK